MPFVRGMLLGLAMILPIGPQNLYILTQGLRGARHHGLLAAAVAGFCDTTLIIAGAAGLSVLFTQPLVRTVLIVLGCGFLIYLGVGALRSRRHDVVRDDLGKTDGKEVDRGNETSTGRVITATVAVSWGNPHAILDTVAVLGTAVAAQPVQARIGFAGGTIAASWVFFVFLALSGSWLGPRLTPTARLWIDRGSGLLMLLFAVVLGRQFLLF